MRRTMYKVHKWLAVTVGVFFLVWLISGIVMILPPLLPGPAQTRTPLNFQEITVSPGEAVAGLAKVLGKLPRVDSVSVKRIRDTLVYHIIVKSGDSHLIDARSGEVFTITPEIAEQIARDYVPAEARIVQIQHVNSYNYAYQWGPLPAHRIVFDNDRSTAYYVSSRDGTVRHSDRETRIRGAITSLHTFQPLKLITRRAAVRKGLLLLLSVLGIMVAGTGYYLALPRRRPSQQKLIDDAVVPQAVAEQVSLGFESSDKTVSTSFQRRG